MKLQAATFAVVFAFGMSVVGMGFMVTRTHAKQTAAEQQAHQPKRDLRPLWPAPDFELPDQRGSRLSKASLKGRPWVANFIFTTCRSVCPLLTAKMVQLQRKLPEAKVAFVSFSVDPEHDDPMTLAAYAQRWAPDETRWSLLSTTDATLKALLEGFKVAASKSDAGIDPIVHSSIFVLVDANGDVRGAYDSEHREEFQALVHDTALFSGATVAAQPARAGPELYAQLSCGACHDNAALAPQLGGLYGKRVELETGLLIDVDDGYLLESILAPDNKRVRGYPLRMPTYDGLVESQELTTLLQYVKGLPEAKAVAAPKTAEDPVCHMQVVVAEDSPHAGDVYFCSQRCRDEYARHRH
jgi:protein SCO1/2